MRINLLSFLIFLFLANISFPQFPKYLYGIISYYGDEFAGKRTANGEVYDPNKFTAAHKTLPFGTQILVENLENGKKVKLTINDRGPFVENRILDVSKRAAQELGFLRKGTAYAKITILTIGEGKVLNPDEDLELSSDISSSSSSSIAPTSTLKSSSIATELPPEASFTSSYSSYSINTRMITNYVVIEKTNFIFITNIITNVTEIKPYTDRIVETVTTQKVVNEEFILEEPEEEDLLPVFSSSSSKSLSSSSSSKTIIPSEESLISSMRSSSISSVSLITSNTSSVIVMEKEVVIDYADTNKKETLNKQVPIIEPAGNKYMIQVGAFTKEGFAMQTYELLRKEGFPVFTTEEVTNKKKMIKIRIGYYSTKKEAEDVLNKLKKYKLDGIILLAK